MKVKALGWDTRKVGKAEGVPSKQDCELMYGALCKMKMWDPLVQTANSRKEKKPLLKIIRYWDLPGGLAAGALRSQCREHGFGPWSGN